MKKLGDNGKKALTIACIVLFIILSVLVFWYVGKPMLSFVSEPDKFRDWVDGHGLLGRAAFIGMMVLQTFVAIIPGEPLEIGAGYAFGAVEGTILCVTGTVIGTAAVFAFVRAFGVRAVEMFFSREKILSLRFLKNAKKLNTVMFIVFLIPGTPKDLLTYFAGLTNIKFSTMLLISAVARFPSVITSTVGGNALGNQNYTFAVVVFAVTAAISAVGLIVYNKMSKVSDGKTKDPAIKAENGKR